MRSNDHFLIFTVHLVNVFLNFFYKHCLLSSIQEGLIFIPNLYLRKENLSNLSDYIETKLEFPTQVFLTSEPGLLTTGVALLKAKFSFYLS